MNKLLVSFLLGMALSHLPLAMAQTPKAATAEVANKAVAVNPQSEKININTASMEQLKLLKGIGDAKAKAIIEYRKQ